jgi:hypothetical protein
MRYAENRRERPICLSGCSDRSLAQGVNNQATVKDLLTMAADRRPHSLSQACDVAYRASQSCHNLEATRLQLLRPETVLPLYDVGQSAPSHLSASKTGVKTNPRVLPYSEKRSANCN